MLSHAICKHLLGERDDPALRKRVVAFGLMSEEGALTEDGVAYLAHWNRQQTSLAMWAKQIIEEHDPSTGAVDLSMTMPRCGLALGHARDQGWIADDDEHVLVVTPAGKEALCLN